MSEHGLQDFTEQQLKDELKRRDDERKEREKVERIEKIKLVVEHRDVLAKLIDHDRTSCHERSNGDFNEHGAPRCDLCALLELEEWMDDVDIHIGVQIRRVSE